MTPPASTMASNEASDSDDSVERPSGALSLTHEELTAQVKAPTYVYSGRAILTHSTEAAT